MKKLFLLIAGMFLITFLNAQTNKVHNTNVTRKSTVTITKAGTIIDTGFRVLPRGFFSFNGNFGNNNHFGYWSNTPGVNIGITWNWSTKVHNSNTFNIGSTNYRYGIAVFCVKNF